MTLIQNTLPQRLYLSEVATSPASSPVPERLPSADPVFFALVLMAFLAFLKNYQRK